MASGEAAVAEAVAAAQAASAGQAADLAKQVEGPVGAALRFQVESEGARRRTLEQLAQAHAATPAPSTRIDADDAAAPDAGERPPQGRHAAAATVHATLAAAAPAARNEVVRIAEGLDDVPTVVDHATRTSGGCCTTRWRLGAAAYAILVHVWLVVVSSRSRRWRRAR